MTDALLPGTRYTRGAIVLHWLIAVLIVLNFVSALTAEDLPRAARAELMDMHKATGITILVLSLLRVLWRAGHRPPPLAPTLRAWERTLARAVHAAFYVLMIVVPLAGWVLASGRPLSWYGLFPVPQLPYGDDRAVAGAFGEIHELGAWLMLALIVLHVAAALKHQLVDRDGTLARMFVPERRTRV